MKPRIVFKYGFWYCTSNHAWGVGYSVREAWESWQADALAGVPA